MKSIEPRSWAKWKGRFFDILEVYSLHSHASKGFIKPQIILTIRDMDTREEYEVYLRDMQDEADICWEEIK